MSFVLGLSLFKAQLAVLPTKKRHLRGVVSNPQFFTIDGLAWGCVVLMASVPIHLDTVASAYVDRAGNF